MLDFAFPLLQNLGIRPLVVTARRGRRDQRQLRHEVHSLNMHYDAPREMRAPNNQARGVRMKLWP